MNTQRKLTDEEKLRAQWLIAEIENCTVCINAYARTHDQYRFDWSAELTPIRAALGELLGPLPVAQAPAEPKKTSEEEYLF